jgi:hypothetical protein
VNHATVGVMHARSNEHGAEEKSCVMVTCCGGEFRVAEDVAQPCVYGRRRSLGRHQTYYILGLPAATRSQHLLPNMAAAAAAAARGGLGHEDSKAMLAMNVHRPMTNAGDICRHQLLLS